MSVSTEIKISNKIDSKYRKIYRSLVEKCKKLDEIYKSENAFLRIFHPETTLLREKLKTYCETLIFREPVEFAKKAEEILWRKAFYEVITIVKLNKKSLKCNAEIETMYRMHLTSAYGFYHHLLLRFQSEFHSIIQLDGFLNFSLVSFEKLFTSSQSQEKSLSSGELLKEVAIRILHKFLICLGDLARYQTEYDPRGCTRQAYKYYHMSLALLPTNGMPLNQLGTLYGSENYGCDAAYYYLYCLSCTEPFSSARENLRLVFSKNRRRYQEIKTSSSQAVNRLEEQRTKEIKRFLVNFLGTIDYILCNSALLNSKHQSTFEKINNQQLQEMCQHCLQQFNSCMFYPSSCDLQQEEERTTTSDDLNHLSDELVFKLTILIIMTIEQLKMKKFPITSNVQQNQQNQANNKPQLNVYFTFVAFALVFFSHIINHTIIRLQEVLMSKHTNKMLEKIRLNELDDDEEKIEEKKDLELKEDEVKEKSKKAKSKKKNKKSLRLIYGHRRRKHNSDSDTNDEDEESSDDSKVFNEGEDDDDDDDDEDDDEEEEDEDIKSRQRPMMPPRRRMNVAKFLERENLSETEMNELSNSNSSTNTSTESDSDSSSSNKPSTKQHQSKTATKQPNPTNVPIKTKPSEEDFPSFSTLSTHQSEQNALFGLNSSATSNNNNLINFKEFSVQLSSNFFSSLNQSAFTTAGLSSSHGSGGADEFIDNEIYKIVLNGGKDDDNMLAEMNPKEAFEIEELGKKIATFQIETDDDDDEDENKEEEDEIGQDTVSMQREAQNKEEKLDSEENPAKTSRIKSTNLLNLQNAQEIVDAFESLTLLPTIKVFCDWLLCNKKIIQSISNVPTTIWSKLAILLNLIPLEKQIAKICTSDKIKSLIIKSAETKSWNHYPLSEDVKLRSFNGLRLEHIALKFDLNKQNELSDWEEHFLRLCSLRRFGYLIASLSQSQANNVPGSVKFFEYDNRRALFVAHETTTSMSTSVKEEAKEEKPTSLTKVQSSLLERKLQLMKSMAKLKLEAEISQLESRVDESSPRRWSPYLVPDTAVLCNCLKMVQDVVKANKSLIIIPLVVIDALDMMKKESKFAREAIRWLEIQFKQGNRFLRPQNQTEKLGRVENNNKAMKKKDVEVWRANEIADCCAYFQHHHQITQGRSVVSLVYDANNAYWDEETDRFKNALDILKENDIGLIKVQELRN